LANTPAIPFPMPRLEPVTKTNLSFNPKSIVRLFAEFEALGQEKISSPSN
jgi:hypothetical protein